MIFIIKNWLFYLIILKLMAISHYHSDEPCETKDSLSFQLIFQNFQLVFEPFLSSSLIPSHTIGRTRVVWQEQHRIHSIVPAFRIPAWWNYLISLPIFLLISKNHWSTLSFSLVAYIPIFQPTTDSVQLPYHYLLLSFLKANEGLIEPQSLASASLLIGISNPICFRLALLKWFWLS